MALQQKLAELQLLTAKDDPAKISRVPLHAFAQCVSDQKSAGGVTWTNGLRRDDATEPDKVKVGKQVTVLPKDLPRCLLVILGTAGRDAFFQDETKAAALLNFMKRAECADADAIVESEVARVVAQAEDQYETSRAFMGALFRGNPVLFWREGDEIVVGVHSFLQAVDVDKDGMNNDWKHWLRKELEAHIKEKTRDIQRFVEARNSETDAGYHSFPRLVYVRRSPDSAHLTPAVNRAALEYTTLACIQKSKLLVNIGLEAMSFWSRVKAGDASLLAEIDANAQTAEPVFQEFVTGKKRELTGGEERILRARSQVGDPSTRRIREPYLDWKADVGAERKEVPAAKAMLKTLFEIEVAAGAMPRSPAPDCSAPQTRFRELAEAALAAVRAVLQKRLGPVATADDASRKRPRQEEQEEVPVLTVSEVMQEAGVWEPVWKAYRSDLSNRMLQIKCQRTQGAFSDRRMQEVAGGVEVQVHRYLKPEDWATARRALEETKDLYEKRARELLESAFVLAGVYDDVPRSTHAGICAVTARALTERLVLEVGGAA